jgi:hypothetical protein
MHKILQQFIIICLLLFLTNCRDKTTVYQNDLQFNAREKKDTIKSLFFSEIVKRDSIKVLEFKRSMVGSDTIETMQYIDYRVNNIEKLHAIQMNYDSELANAHENKPASALTKGVSLKEKYPELLGTYARVKIYKKSPCLYFFDYDLVLKLYDDKLIELWMNGPEAFFYESIKKKRDIYEIKIMDNPYISTIKIKLLHDKYNLSVWHISGKTMTKGYSLLAPITQIRRLPIIYTLNSVGLDDAFEDFDNINYKCYFK